MNSLVRWNPLREMAAMQNMMDRFFDEWRPGTLLDDVQRVGFNRLAVDMDEDDKQYTITTELPGVKSENINVRYEGDMLLIDAEIPETVTEHKGNGNGEKRTLVKERRYGRFSRRIQLPSHVNFDKVEATFENGVLTLVVPKAAETQPRAIKVKAK